MLPKHLWSAALPLSSVALRLCASVAAVLCTDKNGVRTCGSQVVCSKLCAGILASEAPKRSMTTSLIGGLSGRRHTRHASALHSHTGVHIQQLRLRSKSGSLVSHTAMHVNITHFPSMCLYIFLTYIVGWLLLTTAKHPLASAKQRHLGNTRCAGALYG